MRVLYIDCIAGASGDMLLAAFVDAGVSDSVLAQRLEPLDLPGFELRFDQVTRGGLAATTARVTVDDDVSERHVGQIIDLIERGGISDGIKRQAITIFRRMAAVEARIHRADVDKVHLHELGGVDTIVDVVGVLCGVDELGADRIICSPVPLGRGFTSSAHGRLPLPAPATVALLKGAPIVGRDESVELVTPTGAALLMSLADAFGPLPSMTVDRIGYGAGARDQPQPNVLRLVLGDSTEVSADRPKFSALSEQLTLLETNIDDCSPELFDYAMERLFEAGALDVFLHPLQMKKNRQGAQLSVLCRPELSDALIGILFAETTTLGVRAQSVRRVSLPREELTVSTAYGDVRVKVAQVGDRTRRPSPEYDDCASRARASGTPLQVVYRAALRAAEELLQQPR